MSSSVSPRRAVAFDELTAVERVELIETYAAPLLARDPFRTALAPETSALLLDVRYALVTRDPRRIQHVRERWDAHLAALPEVEQDEARGRAAIFAQLVLGLT